MSDEMKWEPAASEAEEIGSGSGETTENSVETDYQQKKRDREYEELKKADIPWLEHIYEINQRQEQRRREDAKREESFHAASAEQTSDIKQEREPLPQSGGGNGPVPPKYGMYQTHQEDPKPEKRPSSKKEKKESRGFGSRLVSTVVLAAVFGLVAGLIFQGVNVITGKYSKTQTVPIGTTDTVPDTTAEAETNKKEDLENIVASSGTVAGVAQAAMPSVVAITSVSIQEIPSFFSYYGFGYGMQEYPSTGSGSGIIVGENDDELLIATNNHVVEGATTLSVCFIGNDVVGAEKETQSLASGDGDIDVENAVSAKIKGTDPDNDLAVVSVQKSDIPEETMNEIKIAQIGSSDDLLVGEQVVAIGNALGYGQSVTSGWISALNRSVMMSDGTSSDLIQTDAAINPGNSGGALLNMRGELIGINSAKYADNAVEGMGYAIPISKAQPILEELMNRKTREKVDASKAAFLGVTVIDLSDEATKMYNVPSGAFVTEANEGRAAAAAGIQQGDIIVKLDGQKVSGKSDLVEKLTYYEAGEVVEIVIARANDGEYVEKTLDVTLGSRPD